MAEIRLDLDLRGLDDVQSMLNRATQAIEPPLLTESVKLGAEIFLAAAEAAAPVGDSARGDHHPGDLRGSMHMHEDGPTAYVVAPMTVYANVQNRGGVNHVKPGTYVRIKAQHYMQKAFTAGEDAAAEAVIEAIDARIQG